VCGILGAVIAGLAIEYGVLPACLGMRSPDPAFRSRVLARNEHRPVRRVAVNSFGFGGINCTLILGAAA
jgi:3-oxoacyl-[acyl-carrier-protein] synthase-1